MNPDDLGEDALVATCNVRVLDTTEATHDLVLSDQLDAITALIEAVDNDPGDPHEQRREASP